jgi:y4mF family transcriptional regulator
MMSSFDDIANCRRPATFLIAGVRRHGYAGGMKFQTSKELAALLRERRKRLGWSQQQVATKVGVGRDWIVQLEKGKPTVELALVLRALRSLGLKLELEEDSTAVGERTIDLNALFSKRVPEDKR